MARHTGPKDRLSRREGFDLFGKGSKLTRLTVPPGVHGPKGQTRRLSQYGRQLREKQKVKRIYGVLEKQFKKYVNTALNSQKNAVDVLYALLETRLDNLVYRLGFSQTRPQARQLVGHRHVLVDGQRVNIPSYQVKIGQTITLSKKAMETPILTKLLQDREPNLPDWLKRKAAAGTMTRLPNQQDSTDPIEWQDIIEFYSR